MYFKINIPEPCDENWHDMTPTEQGKFCASCEKEVIDFTKYTDSEIANRFKNGKHLCGRFRAGQLEREIFAPSEKRRTPWKLVASFTTLMAMAGGAFAQDDKNPKTEQIENSAKKNTNPKTKLIKGNVTADDDLPLLGAAVELIGTNYSTVADFDGNYEMEVPINSINENSQVKISYVGYLDIIKPINSAETCKMQQDVSTMEEVIILGGAFARGIKVSKSSNSGRKPRSRWMRRRNSKY